MTLPDFSKLTRRNHISPDALAAIITLEQATTPHGLGPAFATAEREAKRLGPHWGLSTIAALLTFPAFVTVAIVMISPSPAALWGALALLATIAGLNWFVTSHGPRAAALTRVNSAIGRWRHLVPAMGAE